MGDPRNEDYYAETPSEKARREREEKKQLLKEAFKEALAEDRAERSSGGVVISDEKLMRILEGRG
jgi:hypothetical protein